MLKQEVENILNPELFFDDPNFHKFMQVHENKETQYVSFETEFQRVLALIHNRYRKNSNTQ